MNVALFGGTFDPIHRGHLAVARAAQQQHALQQVLFVPSGCPPHRRGGSLTSFHHRYTMVALATADEPTFVPSQLEDPELSGVAVAGSADAAHRPVTHSIDTVRRLRRVLEPGDRLFFLIGIDAFLDIGAWYEPEALLHEAEFIVASRPGCSLADVANGLPERVRIEARVAGRSREAPATGDPILGGITLHLLATVSERISATQVRAAARSGHRLEPLVGRAVAEYVRRRRLY